MNTKNNKTNQRIFVYTFGSFFKKLFHAWEFRYWAGWSKSWMLRLDVNFLPVGYEVTDRHCSPLGALKTQLQIWAPKKEKDTAKGWSSKNERNPEYFLDGPQRPHSCMWNPTATGFCGNLQLCQAVRILETSQKPKKQRKKKNWTYLSNIHTRYLNFIDYEQRQQLVKNEFRTRLLLGLLSRMHALHNLLKTDLLGKKT